MATAEETGHASTGKDYTQDGTIYGSPSKPVSRSMTGTWAACSFIVGIVHVTPGSFNATFDAAILHLGPNAVECAEATPLDEQLRTLYCSLYIIALGCGGAMPLTSTFGADQFDDFEAKERTQKNSLHPTCLTAFATIFMHAGLVVYDRYFVPSIRQYTKNPRGITSLQRMGIGFALHIIIMVTASLIERKRLTAASANGISGKDETVHLTVFILLPQFAFMGIGESLLEVALLEFFYDQAPEAMKSLGTSYYSSSR